MYYQLELGLGTSPDEMTVIAHSALIRTANGSGPPNGGNHHDASPQPAMETGPRRSPSSASSGIHGKTSAGTRITIDDEPVAVDAGGEFEAGFPLIDGRSMFPVVGTNSSGTERRTVAIVVEHHARHIEPERPAWRIGKRAADSPSRALWRSLPRLIDAGPQCALRIHDSRFSAGKTDCDAGFARSA